MKKLLQKLFSIRNDNEKSRKNFTVCGFKIKARNRIKLLELELNRKIAYLEKLYQEVIFQ